jgi:hypothetical protein
MLKTTTCRHFNGLINKQCDLGIAYESVAKLSGHEDPPMYRKAYPCIPHGLPLSDEVAASLCCAQASYPTKEEEDADTARVMEVLRLRMEDITNSICPDHKIPITKVQIGRCVYAEPCGCRLYQGRLKKA